MATKEVFTWAFVSESGPDRHLVHMVPTEKTRHEIWGYRCWCSPVDFKINGVDTVLHKASISMCLVPDYLPAELV